MRAAWMGLAMLAATSLAEPTGATAQEPPRADSTPSVDALLAAAREAARTDQNARSVALFETLLRRAPERRPEVLREYADQLTYSGRAAAAVPLFREVIAAAAQDSERRLARLGLALALSWSDSLRAALREYSALAAERPTDREALLGQARVLSWLDRQDEARAAYAAALRLNPADAEARRGLAQVQSWRGKQRDARARLRELLRERPDDREAATILARAQLWMGRPDLARGTVETFLGGQLREPAVAELVEEIRAVARPVSVAGANRAEQSDELRIAEYAAVQTLPLQRGRGEVIGSYRRLDYEPSLPPVVPLTVHLPGVHLRYRAADWAEVNAGAQLQRIQAPDSSGLSEPLYNGWITLWPNDHLRADAGVRRTSFDNVRSLLAGLTATHASLAADWYPDERRRFAARADAGRYSDGNRRWWAQLDAEWRAANHPRLWLGAELTGFRFAELRDNGYFNPRRYASAVGTLHGWTGRTGQARLEAFGAAGREWIAPGEDKPLWSVGVTGAVPLGDRVELELRYAYFSSLVASSSGFARETVGVHLRARW